MREISDEKIKKYIEITSKAIGKARIAAPDKTQMHAAAERVLEMAQCYLDDAKHFREKDDVVNAFACINYAHGWLDCGASLGLLEVDHDSTLFTVE